MNIDALLCSPEPATQSGDASTDSEPFHHSQRASSNLLMSDDFLAVEEQRATEAPWSVAPFHPPRHDDKSLTWVRSESRADDVDFGAYMQPLDSILHAPVDDSPRPHAAHPNERARAKKFKWTSAEDEAIIKLRGSGMKWTQVSEKLTDRSPISCRLRYQNYLEKETWDDAKTHKFVMVYNQLRNEMWQKVAEVMGCPWRTAEAMYWKLGQEQMAQCGNAEVESIFFADGTSLPQ